MMSWPRTDLPMTSSLTTSELSRASWWQKVLRFTSGVEQVCGHGAGFRLHGRNTLKPCVGLASGEDGAAIALATPNGAVTVAPLFTSCSTCDGRATMKNLPFWPVTEASFMSNPARARASGSILPLITYWFSGSSVRRLCADAEDVPQAAPSPTTAHAIVALLRNM